MKLKTFTFFLLMGVSTILTAQPSVNICLAKADSFWQVVLIPDSAFSGLVSNIQFTIAMPPDAGGVDSISQSGSIKKYLPLHLAGQKAIESNFAYQKFAGFGLRTLDSLNATWNLGDTIAFCNIYLKDSISLVEDSWTIENNGDYYLELNGEDQTGIISFGCKIASPPTSIQEISLPIPWRVFPNPVENSTQIESSINGRVSIELFDKLGKTYFQQNMVLRKNSSSTLDLPPLSPGVYFLRIKDKNNQFTFKLLKQ